MVYSWCRVTRPKLPQIGALIRQIATWREGRADEKEKFREMSAVSTGEGGILLLQFAWL